MSTPIIIDAEVVRQLKAIVHHGQMNKYDHKMMVLRAAHKIPPPGDLMGFDFTLPLGYRVVPSLLLQPSEPREAHQARSAL